MRFLGEIPYFTLVRETAWLLAIGVFCFRAFAKLAELVAEAELAILDLVTLLLYSRTG